MPSTTVLFDTLTFENAEVGNAKFVECAFTSVTVSGGRSYAESPSAAAKLDSVNLRASTLTDVVFDNCVLNDVDWPAPQ